MNKYGFSLLGSVIVLAIISLAIFAALRMTDSEGRNQVEKGQDAVNAANDAAQAQNEYNNSLQQGLNNLDPAPVNYGSAREKAEQLQNSR